MDERVLGLIPNEDWLNVGLNVARPNDPLDDLFDDIRTDNIMAAWQSIAAEYQIPVMANFHAFDTESLQTFRVPIDSHNIEKGLIKVKINQSERLRLLLRAGVREDQLYDYIIQDGVRLADQVVTRSKVAKAEVLATGEMTIRENNLDLTVDYGVSAEQTGLTLDLSSDADIPGQLQAIVDQAAEKGVTLTGLVTARKNLTRMRRNTSFQTAINGSLGAGAMVPRGAFESFLGEEFGFSHIVTHDLTYGIDSGVGLDGRPVVTTKRYFPDNVVTFFAANPGGRLGSGLWGNPPEVDIGRFYPVEGSLGSPFVYVTQKAEWDPAVVWTKASGLFIPVLFNPASLWIATVTV